MADPVAHCLAGRVHLISKTHSRAEPGRRREDGRPRGAQARAGGSACSAWTGCWWKRSRSSTWAGGHRVRVPEPRCALPAGRRLPAAPSRSGPARPSTLQHSQLTLDLACGRLAARADGEQAQRRAHLRPCAEPTCG